MGAGGESTEISISRLSTSPAPTAGNRGSCRAALMAARAIVSTRGSGDSTWPTQPRSRLSWWSVTKAPAGSVRDMTYAEKSRIRFSTTAFKIARRARSNKARQSSLESRDILRVLAPLENSQAAPLLYTAIHAAPKLLKLLDRRDDSAPHHQP